MEIIYLSLHDTTRMTPALRWAAMRDILMFTCTSLDISIHHLAALGVCGEEEESELPRKKQRGKSNHEDHLLSSGSHWAE